MCIFCRSPVDDVFDLDVTLTTDAYMLISYNKKPRRNHIYSKCVRNLPCLRSDRCSHVWLDDMLDLESISDLINITDLYITGCRKLKSFNIPSYTSLTSLQLNNCDVVLIPSQFPNLKTLHLDCLKMKSISSFPSVNHMSLANCNDIVSITDFPSLTYLQFYQCWNVRFVDGIGELSRLIMNTVPKLLFINPLPKTESTTYVWDCSQVLLPYICFQRCMTKHTHDNPCPYPPTNSINDNYQKVIKIQRWFRQGRKQTFKRFITSQSFVEWIYSPNQLGGRCQKRHLMRAFEIKIN